MKIHDILQSIAEKILNRRCEYCKYNNGFICTLNQKEYEKCISGILPSGFERSELNERNI